MPPTSPPEVSLTTCRLATSAARSFRCVGCLKGDNPRGVDGTTRSGGEMRLLLRLVRALLHRPGTTVVVLLVSFVAAAAAAAAPTYYEAARTSILRDTLTSSPFSEGGFELTAQGSYMQALDQVKGSLDTAVDAAVPDAAMRRRAFQPPIEALEASAYFASGNANVPLVWRSDFCAHLQLVAGACAASNGQVLVSESLARHNGWKVGQRLAPNGWPTFVVRGIYAVPDFSLPYWFGRGGSYFPTEDVSGTAGSADQQPVDAMFTPRATIQASAAGTQGVVVIDMLIDNDTVQGADLDVIANATTAMTQNPALQDYGASLESGLPGLVSGIHTSWRTLAITEFLVAVQLLMLVWLLMFLVVQDAVEARAAEIALVKLRGYKGLRLLGFGLAEPLSLLTIALPLGVVGGWALSLALAHSQLRHGTAVELPGLAWAAAGIATLGGLVAVAVAGRRALRRSVVDQWRRTVRHGADRGWVVDAIVVTAAIACVIELRASGQITSVGNGSLGLLEPGLFGLAAAVVASRLLPVLCRRAYDVTRTRGGLGLFLAVRHIARRSSGARTTVILATAFALATFGIAAWSTSRANRALVASVSLGAPTVLTVQPAPDKDLAASVDAVDPGGHDAAAVDSYYNGGTELLAVQPSRFAAVAAWRARFSSQTLPVIAKKLQPAVAPPVELDGDQLRLRLHVAKLAPSDQVVVAEVASRGSPVIQVNLGSIDTADGDATLTARLVGCPCQLRDLVVSPPTSNFNLDVATGSLTIAGLDVHSDKGWTAIPSATRAGQWRTDPATAETTEAAGGLQWSFSYTPTSAVVLNVADYPYPIPALAARTAVGPGSVGTVQANNVDGQSVTVAPIAVAAAIPGSTTSAVLVDRDFALRASGGYESSLVTSQVWVAAGAQQRIEAGLRKAGVRIVAVSNASDQAALFARQGPGLAGVVFLANALAAAILAAGAAIVGLVTAARRRRYEYAALLASGASKRTLFAALYAEQVVGLVFAAVVGIAAGLASAAVAVRGVPEFVTQPQSPPLSYVPDFALLAVTLAAAIAALFLLALASSWALVGGVEHDQLREAPA